MKQAHIFPGQGAQFVGMGKDLYDQYPLAQEMFEKANEILGFRITDLMFSGTDEDLKETRVTQPAIFLHSVIAAECFRERSLANGCLAVLDMTAGHSLGEFSALVAAKSLSFEDGLRLVAARANAMQKACEAEPSTMAAILGLEDEIVENICKEITVGATLAVDPPAGDTHADCNVAHVGATLAVDPPAGDTHADCDVAHVGATLAVDPPAGENPPFTVHRSPFTVVPANYNSPGQLVISGTIKGIELACQRLKEAGAKRALPLKVGGAFHSPLMQPAAEELKKAIEQTEFKTPICPIYQNVDAKPHTDPAKIKENLILQLTAPVRWTQMVQNMLADASTGRFDRLSDHQRPVAELVEATPYPVPEIEFTEFGPGTVLTGLVGKIRDKR